MATLIRVGSKPEQITLEDGEASIKKLLGCDFLDQVPLGNDPKKAIDRTMWADEDREIYDLPENKEAIVIVETLTTPTKESMTHRAWMTDKDGNEVPITTVTDKVSEFPPIRGDVIITNLEEDGL